jgi:serine/threonine protein phosphatase PrpC
VIKDGNLYWGNVCDSGVAVVARHGVLKFRSDDGWSAFNATKPENWKSLSAREQTLFQRKNGRNRVDSGGKRVGYGTVNGESTVERYVDSGVFPLENGDRVILCTDGFASYFDRKEFLDIVGELPEDTEARIRAIQFGKASFHDLYEYHSEGTLLIIPYISKS